MGKDMNENAESASLQRFSGKGEYFVYGKRNALDTWKNISF